MYKKKIKRGNKEYIYYYHNKRVGNKVKNICLGKDLKQAKRKISQPKKPKATQPKEPQAIEISYSPLHHTKLLIGIPRPEEKHSLNQITKVFIILLILIFTAGFFYYFNIFNPQIIASPLGQVINEQTIMGIGTFENPLLTSTQEQPNTINNIIEQILNKGGTILGITGRITQEPTIFQFEVNKNISTEAYILLNFNQIEYTKPITEFGLTHTNQIYNIQTLSINPEKDFDISFQNLPPGEYQIILSLIDNNIIQALQIETISIGTPQEPISEIEEQPDQTETPQDIIPSQEDATISKENITIHQEPTNQTQINIIQTQEPTNITTLINLTQPTEKQNITNIQTCKSVDDCGENYNIEPKYCFKNPQVDNRTIYQDRVIHSCYINNTCGSIIIKTINQTCPKPEICFQGACFHPENLSSLTQTTQLEEQIMEQTIDQISIIDLPQDSLAKDMNQLIEILGFDPWAPENNETNLTKEEYLLIQSQLKEMLLTKVKVNQGVPFVKRIVVEETKEPIQVPNSAENLKVYQITNQTEETTQRKLKELQHEPELKRKPKEDVLYQKDSLSPKINLAQKEALDNQNKITAQAIKDLESKGFLTKLAYNLNTFLKTLFSSTNTFPTGAAITETFPVGETTTENTPTNSTLEIEENQKGDIIEIFYMLPGPEMTEQQLTPNKKKLTISSPFHYQNITAITGFQDPSVTLDRKIKLYHINNNTKTQINYTSIDRDYNNIIDTIEWEIPHLSTQEYEIELIILNTQSYPVIGGEWEVQFNTTGTENLTITAVQNTTYAEVWENDLNTTNDLEIIKILCGNTTIFNKQTQTYSENVSFILEDGTHTTPQQTINQSLNLTSIFIQDYNCDNQISYHTVNVLTTGDHYQEFDFGGLKQIAQNDAGTWWNTSFRKCKDITIKNMNGTDTLTNFPMLINVTHDEDMQTQLQDIRFVDTSCKNGGSTLKYEIEDNITENNAEAWVKIPSIPSSGTTISMYYGNETFDPEPEPSEVWNNNYVFVYHMNEDKDSYNAVDSTGNALTATRVGSPQPASGIVSNSRYYDGSDEYLRLDDHVAEFPGALGTVELWVNRDWADSTSTDYGLFDLYHANTRIAFLFDASDSQWDFFCEIGNAYRLKSLHESYCAQNKWCHMTMTWSDNNNEDRRKIYTQGREWEAISDEIGTWDSNDPTVWNIGAGYADNKEMLGEIDEVRMSNISRAGAWINMTYEAIANPTNVVTFGNEESIGCATDDDCESDSECLAYFCFAKEGRFVIQNSTNDNLTIIDKYGQVAFKGTWTSSCTDAAAANSFQIKNETDDVIYWINPATGDMCAWGSYTENLAYDPTTGLDGTNLAAYNGLRIQNDTNNVSFFTDKDGTGHFYVAKNIIFNALI